MNPPKDMSQSVPLTAVLLLILVSAIWGGNIVSIKVSNQGIPPILAATLRSLIASALIWMYATLKGERVFLGRPDFKHGVTVGILFALDFLFLYWGPAFTDASRAVIFLYTTPLWVTIGAHFVLPTDRLTPAKTLGVVAAFMGLITVFGSGSASLGPLYWVGDLMEVAAAICWAATTIYIKKIISQKPLTHFQTLFAQLFFSVPILALGSMVFERNLPVVFALLPVLAFAYQTLVVAFFSYLLWFWMIHHYPVSRLSSFTFLAPLFGVLFSDILLGETLTPLLLLGLALVATGIYLVNRPENTYANSLPKK